jgi:hypothetical protein
LWLKDGTREATPPKGEILRQNLLVFAGIDVALFACHEMKLVALLKSDYR